MMNDQVIVTEALPAATVCDDGSIAEIRWTVGELCEPPNSSTFELARTACSSVRCHPRLSHCSSPPPAMSAAHISLA